MPDEPLPDDGTGLRAANAGLRSVVEAKDAEIAVLRAGLDAERELRRRLELPLAELERLGMDSTDSGTPSSKERIGAREARRARQESERERRKDRKRGGQPGHRGKGLARTLTRVRARPRIRRRSAVPAGRPWTARQLRARGGRRSSTWSSPGR